MLSLLLIKKSRQPLLSIQLLLSIHPRGTGSWSFSSGWSLNRSSCALNNFHCQSTCNHVRIIFCFDNFLFCFVLFCFVFLLFIKTGLMHNCVIRLKFSSKHHKREIFATSWYFRVVFSGLFFSFFSFLHWEFAHDTFTSCILKQGLMLRLVVKCASLKSICASAILMIFFIGL